MYKKPTNYSTKAESSLSETLLKHYYGGNVYEVFVRGREITHAQIRFPAPATAPSAARFLDFPQNVQQHFHELLRFRHP
jgi:hypothetical protein